MARPTPTVVLDRETRDRMFIGATPPNLDVAAATRRELVEEARSFHGSLGHIDR